MARRKTVTTCRQAAMKSAGVFDLRPHEYQPPFISCAKRIITGYAKNADGVPVPKGIVVKKDGKKFVDAEITEMKLLEKLDESEFKK